MAKQQKKTRKQKQAETKTDRINPELGMHITVRPVEELRASPLARIIEAPVTRRADIADAYERLAVAIEEDTVQVIEDHLRFRGRVADAHRQAAETVARSQG